MYKYIIQGIDGAQNFGLISLVIFTTFFALLLLWVYKADNSYINHMKELPMEDEKELKKIKSNDHV